MSISFGTWQDRPYGSIPKTDKGLRVTHHAQRLIESKYPDPRTCPTLEAEIFQGRAVELVRAEDALELPLGV
jgi:hypothetical protein